MKQRLTAKLAVLLILLLATLLRFYNLSGQSLWADEGNSVALARRSFTEIAQRTAFDIHPPLYYWLLKIWITFFGDTEFGLRSLSVMLSVGLVYVLWLIGSYFFSWRVGLIAGLTAAFSPLQVYYAQETRMYMLLTLLSSLTILVALLIFKLGLHNRKWLGFVYVITAAAGLYTHYAYPLILIAVNLAALLHFGFWILDFRFWILRLRFLRLCSGQAEQISNPQSPISNLQSPNLQSPNLQSPIFPSPLTWLVLHLVPFLLYLPWLPIAWRQITTWPSERQPVSLFIILEKISTTLLFGLSWPHDLDTLATAALGLFLIIPIALYISRFTFYPHTGHRASVLRFTFHVSRLTFYVLSLWLLLPILLTLFIFSPAFLKFLLVAAPALALLLATTVELLLHLFDRRWPGYLFGGALLMAVVSGSLLSLYYYFADTTYARDDYRRIVRFIKAVGGANDAVVLNAEGQQDVFNYYYGQDSAEPSVYPLPRRRPLDETATLVELDDIARKANKVYGVYWATHQADPGGLIEGWLDRRLFKATDQWYGNVRLVSYASPQAGADLLLEPVDYQWEQSIRLTGYALAPSEIAAGDILQVILRWQTEMPVAADYTVFLQLLDQHNHLAGQRDASPLSPTTTWPGNEPVSDRHGLFIEPGTPPGKHRLIIGLYDGQTGRRLKVGPDQKDFVELAEIEIIRPVQPLPAGAFSIQVPLNERLLDLSLLGYDLYKLGHRSTPQTPLYNGDPIQLVVYWRLDRPGPQLKDQLSIRVVTQSGEETSASLTRPVAGVDYPVEDWQAGEIIRAQYDFFLTDLKPGRYRLALRLESKDAKRQAEILTNPFQLSE